MSATDASSPAPLVEAGARYDGLVAFHGDVCVEGDLTGEIVAVGTLRIAESARVRARIEVDRLVVAGVVEGDVFARDRVELASTARVRGTVRTPRLALCDGSVLDGRCETGAEASEASPER